jgi:hypothetical protein
MTQRERQASGGVSATVPTIPAGQARTGSLADLARPLPWEALFQAIPPTQRGELLALAARQGLLFAHQLPPPSNGSPIRTDDAPPGTSQFLSALLKGQIGQLRPSTGPAIDHVDSALCPRQREAVVRALNTPDLCLIQGLPGTGKSRVVAEIITQAALRGQHVLLLATTSAALDGILERVGRHEAVFAVRCLARDESAAIVPHGVRPLLFSERLRALAEEAIATTRHTIEQVEARCRSHGQEESTWLDLEECVAANQLLQGRLAELATLCAQSDASTDADRLDADSESRESSPFGRALQKSRSERDVVLGDLGRLREAAEVRRIESSKDAQQKAAALERLRYRKLAKERGHWWSFAFWRATFQGNVAASVTAAEKAQRDAQAAADESRAEVQLLDEKRRQSENFYHQQRKQIISQESARRTKKCDAFEEKLNQETRCLKTRWDKSRGRLGLESPPAICDSHALKEARLEWDRACERDHEQLAFARRWLELLQESAPSWPARVKRLTNLVAATATGLAADENFGDSGASDVIFDLLVLDEADQLTESDFLNFTRRARRTVLVSEQTLDYPVEQSRNSKPPTNKTGRTPPPTPLRSVCFPRLWEYLHCDPSRLPYSWFVEGDRLYCRLIPLTLEQRRRLECEPVADRPEIELRILTLPGDRPLLAEVSFPSTITVQQAKEYIYRELQELPVQTTGRCLRWEHRPEALVLRLADSPPRNAAPAVLEAGVHEWVGSETPSLRTSSPWFTCRVEFQTEAGWSRERAEEWILHRLRLRDLGRTARLDVPWRMRPDLAAIVWDLLYQVPPPDYSVPLEMAGMAALGSRPAVSFIPVPSPSRERRPRERAGTTERKDRSAAASLPRHGAGLEIDLSAGRQAEVIPDDLRKGLPPRGVVNYLEAQEVVRTLEEMALDAVLCATLVRAAGSGVAQIGVFSPSVAQVELIRRLIGKSAILPRGPLAIEVDVPAAFRHRECWIGLVSLTRSHGHRAVSFADSPQTLALALTRARWQLLLFADPGTLARRVAWQGPVDHLNESAAEQERRLASGLIEYVQGRGAHAKGFQIREGNGA